MSRRKQSNPQHVNEPPSAPTQAEPATRPEQSGQLTKALLSSLDSQSQMDASSAHGLMTFESDQRNNCDRERYYEERRAMDDASAGDRRRVSGEYSRPESMYPARDGNEGLTKTGMSIWTAANRRASAVAAAGDGDQGFAMDAANLQENGETPMSYDYGAERERVRHVNAEPNARAEQPDSMVQHEETGSTNSGSPCPSEENRYERFGRPFANPPAIAPENGYGDRCRSDDNATSLKDDVMDQNDNRENEDAALSPMEMQAPDYKQVAEYEERLRQIAEQNLLEQQQRNVQSREHEDLKEKADESKEIDDIKDQVRRLQQQQMCQIQMLNYLHFQLAMVASSNPQPQRPGPCFFPGAQQGFTGINGMQIQSMLASAMANGAAPMNGVLPPVSTGMERQFPNAELLGKKEVADVSEGDDMMRERSPSFEQKRLQASFDVKEKPLEYEDGQPAAPGRLTDEKSDPGTGRHACRYCQKVFGSESALQIHLRSHTGERPFKCNICANRFSTKGNLKVHFVRHKAKYPHIEMNSHPVPEYLDNIPTENGIPFGMSVVPDESDLPGNNSKEGSDGGSPRESLTESRNEADSFKFALPKNQLEADLVRFGNPDAENSNSSDHFMPSAHESGLKVTDPSPTFVAFGNDDISRSKAENFPEQRVKSPSEATKGERTATKAASSSTGVVQAQPARLPSSDTKKLENLVNQIDRGKDLEKNECHICRRVLSCQSALKLHYRTHTGERPYKCDLCSRAFTTRGNLRTHYSSVHRQQLRPSPPQNSSASRSSVLQCPLCGSRFMDQQSLQQHMQMHLYINSQQQQQQQQQHQQQIARLMSGQQPGVVNLPGYPPVSVPSTKADGGAPSPSADDNPPPSNNQTTGDQSEDDSWRQNEVFEEQSPAQIPTTRETNEDAMRSPNGHNGASTPTKSDRCDESGRFENGAKQPSALDLTRQNSSSPVAGPVESVGAGRNDMREASPMKSVSNPLSELAHLASSSAIMRPGGMAMMSLQASPPSDEIRQRKMSTACEICNKPFTCQSALEIHLRSHTKERPYVCRICERGFTTKGNLKQHLLTHNITEVDDDMLEPVSSPAAGNSTTAESPVSSPSTASGAQSNGTKRPSESSQTQPSAKRTYPRHWCHICQKQFSSASSLQIHNRTHTGEKPFACSVCGRAFTTKGNLKVHMGTHVWGAGGSRRGRRISMDNPLISPWMQNTSNTAANPGLRPRAQQTLPAVPDPAVLYQQYAALASAGLMNVKANADPRFHGNGILNLNNSAAARLLLSPGNGHVTPPTAVPSVGQTLNALEAMKANDNKNISAAEWFWKAYQRTQEQVN